MRQKGTDTDVEFIKEYFSSIKIVDLVVAIPAFEELLNSK
jgi:hypothetical protein